MSNINQDKFDEILNRLRSIEKLLQKDRKPCLGDLIDNAELLQMLKINSRTAKRYRDEGLIAFCKIKGRFLYKITDIQDLVNRNYKKGKV